MKRIQQKGLCWPSCQALSPPNCAVHLRIPPIAQFVLVSGTTRTGHNVDELGSTRSTIRSAHPASMGIYRDTIAQFKQGLVPRPEITNHSWHITRKYGFAVNAEQSLTRYLTAFGRFGWTTIRRNRSRSPRSARSLLAALVRTARCGIADMIVLE